MPHSPFKTPGRLGEGPSPAEKAAQQVATALDSVNLINEMIAAGRRSPDELKTIGRNVEHLKIVINRDVVKSSTEDLTPLTAAIEAGQAFMVSEA